MKEFQTTYPDATFTMEINHIADRRIEELISGSKSYFNIRSAPIEKAIQRKLNLPDSLDWRDKNVITAVFNQGSLGKSVAIAAVELIESYQAIQTKNLERGSVDQVSVCCPDSIKVFECILSKLNGGICKRNDYNSSVSTCDSGSCETFARFNNIKNLPPNDEETMLTWIQDSPLFVDIHVLDSLLLYTGGIYSDPSCLQASNGHAMQLVGYGTEAGIPYWLCKNSWGTNWGEQGYVRIERGNNTCGIASEVIQIEFKANTNNGIPSFTVHHIYLVLLCFIAHFVIYFK